MANPETLNRAVADLRYGVGFSRSVGGSVDCVDDLVPLAVTWLRKADYEVTDEEHDLAVQIVADELGLLSGHERIMLRQSLRDAGLNGLLDEQEG